MSDPEAIECPVCGSTWVPDGDPDDRRCPPCESDDAEEDGGVPWL